MGLIYQTWSTRSDGRLTCGGAADLEEHAVSVPGQNLRHLGRLLPGARVLEGIATAAATPPAPNPRSLPYRRDLASTSGALVSVGTVVSRGLCRLGSQPASRADGGLRQAWRRRSVKDGRSDLRSFC